MPRPKTQGSDIFSSRRKKERGLRREGIRGVVLTLVLDKVIKVVVGKGLVLDKFPGKLLLIPGQDEVVKRRVIPGDGLQLADAELGCRVVNI